MGEGAQRKEASYRSACTECARRKQKVTKPCAKLPTYSYYENIFGYLVILITMFTNLCVVQP